MKINDQTLIRHLRHRFIYADLLLLSNDQFLAESVGLYWKYKVNLHWSWLHKTKKQVHSIVYQSRHDVTVLVFILYITVTWKSNIDLQWTVIFATALAGLFTPLLAVHWYWIMLSGVPGLVIFTILMDEPWGKTLESPILVHVIIGRGFPEGWQDNVTLLPSTTISVVLEISTVGATEE